MGKFMWLSVGILSIGLLFIGCGRRAGNNPVGVTGGGESGYGSTGFGFEGDLDPGLFGSWMRQAGPDDWREYVFHSDGRCDLWRFIFDEAFVTHGSYEASAGRIQITMDTLEGGFYWITGDTLRLDLGGESTTWTRLYYP